MRCIRTMYSLYRYFILISLTVIKPPFSSWCFFAWSSLAKRCIFVIENPVSSLIFKHYRFEWLCNKVAYVSSLNYSQAFQDLYRVVRIEKLIILVGLLYLGLPGVILDGIAWERHSKKNTCLVQWHIHSEIGSWSSLQGAKTQSTSRILMNQPCPLLGINSWVTLLNFWIAQVLTKTPKEKALSGKG